jgi:NAD(P)-dependent dehydrogenase (short-subunit alcohol dehydrogenase family)
MGINFDAQVAIVTGAGRGIGRETALGLARRGARVVVNDYGGGMTTMSAGSIDVAQSVVDEIVAAGGIAIAEGSSVGTGASADAIVGRAIEAFGRVDILVNNAGGSVVSHFHLGTDEETEGVIRTNLIGPYMLMRRVWPFMMAQRHGRIVNVESGAVLGGMEKTGAYSAGKAGLIGISNVAATEGAPHDIRVNGVWPIGLTRLAGSLEDKSVLEWMQQFPPELVAEGIVYLCSSDNQATGEIFSIGGGRIARNGFFGSQGFYDRALTAESIGAHINDVRDMSNATLVTSTTEECARFNPPQPS